jgi:hypothetical protein
MHLHGVLSRPLFLLTFFSTLATKLTKYMAPSLENGIIQSGQALPTGGMDPLIPLGLALVCDTALRGICLIGQWHWSEQRIVFLTIGIHAN